jgi:hypothetical protein
MAADIIPLPGTEAVGIPDLATAAEVIRLPVTVVAAEAGIRPPAAEVRFTAAEAGLMAVEAGRTAAEAGRMAAAGRTADMGGKH